MASQENPYPLRIKKTIMQKSKVIALIHNRSLNKEIEHQLIKMIADYESQYGPIPISEPPEAE